jgi:exosortase
MARAAEGITRETAPATGWDQRSRLQFALLVLVVGLLYFNILRQLVEQWWHDPNYSHGFLVPLFSLFIVWTKRKRLATLPVEPHWFGLVVSAGALGILIVGVLGAEQFLSRSSLVILLAGLLIYFRGWQYFRVLLLAWAALFLMIPIPVIVFNEIAFPLQFLASRLATGLLALLGVPVLREGNVIQLPAMSLEVVEACSGIRSLISLVTLAVIYGYFLEPRTSRRVLLVIAAMPIAVVANGLRIMGAGLLGQYWSPDRAQGFFHTFSGWVIFVSAVLMLFFFHSALGWFGSGRKARTSSCAR